MSAAWVAGGVRARALLRRRLGTAGAREVAACPSLPEALAVLAAGPYQRDLRPEHTLAEAEHALGATVLWHLRVLAGWQPRAGSELLRLLAGWFELANILEHLRSLAGAGSGVQAVGYYRLGTLNTAWPRIVATGSVSELRSVLAGSAWGDPGSERPAEIATGLQLGWAARLAEGVPQTRGWALGAAALVVARTRFLVDQQLLPAVRGLAAALLGTDPVQPPSVAVLASRISGPARWALAGVEDAGQLWLAEERWWSRVERDARVLVHRPGFSPNPVVGCVALLAVDARRVRAALELAARGGQPLEAFDALT